MDWLQLILTPITIVATAAVTYWFGEKKANRQHDRDVDRLKKDTIFKASYSDVRPFLIDYSRKIQHILEALDLFKHHLHVNPTRFKEVSESKILSLMHTATVILTDIRNYRPIMAIDLYNSMDDFHNSLSLAISMMLSFCYTDNISDTLLYETLSKTNTKGKLLLVTITQTHLATQ